VGLGVVVGVSLAGSGGHTTTVRTSTALAVPPDDTSSGATSTDTSTTDTSTTHAGTAGSSGGDDAQSASVGDCVRISGSDDAPVVRKLDCGDVNANAKVAVKYDNSAAQCPGHDYQSVWSSAGSFRTCYELNANEGDCFKDDGDKNNVKVDCTDPTARYRVEIHSGTASISVCGATTTADNAYVFPLPSPLTLCLRPPTG
jgi:hypothetical protein